MIYHISQMWTAMRGTMTATLATLSTMIITLCVLAIVILITWNLEVNLKRLESQVEIALFLKPESNGKALLKLIETKYPQIKEIKLISKEQALKEMVADYPYIEQSQALVENPFPDAIRLKLKSPSQTEQTAKELEVLPEVESAEYGQGYMQQTINFIQLLRQGGWVLVGILVVSTFFNILNTVRVAMYARQQEINVMRMLGATPNFIRMPYILEGLLLGTVASMVMCILVYPAYMTLIAKVPQITTAVAVVDNPSTIWTTFLQLGLFGVAIGLVGSFIASYHYLREIE